MQKLNRLLALTALCFIAACSSMNPFASKRPGTEAASLERFTPSMATKVLWTRDVGEANGYFLKPAFIDDLVFAASADGDLTCFDATSGKEIWAVNVGSGITAGVTVDAGLLVVAATDGVVYGVSAESGKPLWKAQASTEVLSAPAIGGGVVLVRSIDNRITAFDAQTGNRRWAVQRTAPPLALRAAPGMIISDGMAYVGLPGGRLLALSTSNGTARWEAPIGEPRGTTELERVADVSGMPVMLGRDICAASYQGRVACVDASNGTLRWMRELSADVGPGIDQRFVFAADERGNLQGYARDTGSSLWRNTTLGNRRLTAPVSFGRAVVVADFEGYVHFFSREEGALLTRLSTGSAAIRATPVIAGSKLIVQTEDGKLIAIATDQ
jgi:outer membrane protein assembly factor BamB